MNLNLAALKILILVFSASAFSQVPPLSTGLPEKLPLDFVERELMVPFVQSAETFHAPVAAGLFFNDKPVPPRDLATMGLVFDEFFLARVPRGRPILSRMNAQRQKIWEYPQGTRVVHAIYFKTVPPQIFEVRVEQKMEAGRWAFGLYTPVRGWLELNHYVGFRPEAYTVTLASGELMRIKLSHLNLQSCQSCHFMNSPSKYQYSDVSSAGPCGFGPANQGLAVDWSARYFKIHGEKPIR
jgi:hypothetical protein